MSEGKVVNEMAIVSEEISTATGCGDIACLYLGDYSCFSTFDAVKYFRKHSKVGIISVRWGERLIPVVYFHRQHLTEGKRK